MAGWMKREEGAIMKLVTVFMMGVFMAATAFGASEPNKPVQSADKQGRYGIPIKKWGIDKRHPDPVVRDAKLPNLIIIGDSTVHNMDKGKVGWGDHIAPFFDTDKINVINWALGGRTTRSFIEEGRWDAALAQTKKGDFILLQLGTNDSKVLSDRGTIKGVGEETQDVAQKDSNNVVTIHSYGWYLRRYAQDARAKGATIIFCTPVPRNSFDESGKMKGSLGDYSGWMKKVAEEEKVTVIDLNAIVIKHYNEMGREKVGAEIFAQGDGTHTSLEGAKANASYVVEGVKGLGKDCRLGEYLKR
jgi:lysophospholipase L1-like esterase